MAELKRAYSNIRKKRPEMGALIDGDQTDELGGALLDLVRKDDDPLLVRDAIEVIGDLKPSEAVGTLFSLARNPSTSSSVKRASVNCLKKFDSDESLKACSDLLGVSESPNDKWIRQLAVQNVTSFLRRLMRGNDTRAERVLKSIRTELLDSENTFTRMNAAIILRNINDAGALYFLEERLKKEEELLASRPDIKGIPYIIKEIEKSIERLK